MGGKPEMGTSPGGNPFAPVADRLAELERRLGVLERGRVREDTPQPVWGTLDWYTINPGGAGQLVTAKIMTKSGAPNWGTMWKGYRRQVRHNALIFRHYIWPIELDITGTMRLLVNGDEVWRKSDVPGGTQDVDSVVVPIDVPLGDEAELEWHGQHDGLDLARTLAAIIYDVTWVDRELA